MLGLKENFLQAFGRKNLMDVFFFFLNPCFINTVGQKRAADLLIHSYVAFDLLHVWQRKTLLMQPVTVIGGSIDGLMMQ